MAGEDFFGWAEAFNESLRALLFLGVAVFAAAADAAGFFSFFTLEGGVDLCGLALDLPFGGSSSTSSSLTLKLAPSVF